MNISNEEDNEFLVEEIERYKLTYEFKEGSLIKTSNDLDSLKAIYDELIYDDITGNIDEDPNIVISIFDYDKNTNIYHYDSNRERC